MRKMAGRDRRIPGGLQADHPGVYTVEKQEINPVTGAVGVRTDTRVSAPHMCAVAHAHMNSQEHTHAHSQTHLQQQIQI